MSYKNILVHLDESERAAARLDFAIEFARAFDAHLAALYVVQLPFVPFLAEAEASAQIIEAQMERARALKDEAKKMFDRRAAAAGISLEWRESEGDAIDTIAMHARHGDLAILGQANPEETVSSNPRNLPELVALSAGRPVLVLPYAGAFRAQPERVMVAWNASREAARAVNDALPLLQRAKQVVLLAVNPRKGTLGHGAVPGADIAAHLARHGVKAVAAQTVAPDEDVGDVLLSRASDEGAELIVMGCYGHSRLRELTLGGVSRHLFGHMTVPVLLSH